MTIAPRRPSAERHAVVGAGVFSVPAAVPHARVVKEAGYDGRGGGVDGSFTTGRVVVVVVIRGTRVVIGRVTIITVGIIGAGAGVTIVVDFMRAAGRILQQ